MRKSRVMMLIVASFVSSASAAHAQVAAPGQRAATAATRAGVRGLGSPSGVLEGIILSDVEKTRLRTIHGRYASESRSLGESLPPAMQAARAARQRGDTAAARTISERNRSGREQVVALRTREEAEVHSALSPENQKRFDANLAQRAEHRVNRSGNRGRKGNHQGDGGATNG